MKTLLTPALAGVMLSACGPTPPPAVTGAPEPGPAVYRAAALRFAAVVVSERRDVDAWLGSEFSRRSTPDDADGGSAVPIAPDGYFLTADHVVESAEERRIYVVQRRDGRLRASPARIVWRSASDDLTLLHSDIRSPDYYRWTPPDEWLPRGLPIMHAGIATGFKDASGKLVSAIPPETAFSGNRRFKHDIPLAPGDSGGPVIDSRGLLVGVNSAVEFLVPLETAFFIESEGNRPNVARLMDRIDRDRRENRSP
jgi:S1-C subfamily serine protease